MIRVENLTKTFKLYQSPADRLKEIVLQKKYHRKFTAVQDVSFEVKAGETLGIIGQNGAGKSTLLKLLMGVLLPDSGLIDISGKITGLLELTTGFNPEFSGMQNIYLNGTLRGMSKQEIDGKLGHIIEFSELQDFIEEPIKTYSSGMIMRLAFAIAIHADPQAFVVDEALSVGDAYFQQKCKNKLMEFKENGGSIVFVSHDLNAVKVLCEKAMLLDHGQTIESGDPDQVIHTYNFLLAKKTKGQEIRLQSRTDKGKAYGNLKIEIISVKMLNSYRQDSEVFVSGERCFIQIMVKAHEAAESVTLGILIQDRFGQDIFGTNTHHMNIPIALVSNQDCLIEYAIDELNIGYGKYTLTVAAHTQETHVNECYHWIDVVRLFEVVGSREFKFIGLSRLKPVVQVYSSISKTIIDRPLSPELCCAEISVAERDHILITAGTLFSVKVKVKNISSALWPAQGLADGHYSIRLGYHVLDKNGAITMHDGLRSALPFDLEPEKEIFLDCMVKSPDAAGDYILEFDMVQEQVTWFVQKGSKTAKVLITVQ